MAPNFGPDPSGQPKLTETADNPIALSNMGIAAWSDPVQTERYGHDQQTPISLLSAPTKVKPLIVRILVAPILGICLDGQFLNAVD